VWSQECDEYADPLEIKFTSNILHQLKKNAYYTYISVNLTDRLISVTGDRKDHGYKKLKYIRKV